MAVGLVNPNTNQTIGVIASTFDLRDVQRNISLAKPQATGEAILLAPDGMVIAGPNEQAISQPAWPSLRDLNILPATGDSSLITEPGWLLGTDRQNNPAVLAHAPLNTTSRVKFEPLRKLGWQVVVSDTRANALAKVTRSTKIASLVGLLVMASILLVAAATARVITRPIEALTTAAAAMSEGQLDQRAEPVGPVELITLADAFNTLTSRLRMLINSLQDQVAQRTAQLEARVDQLATLNRITQTVASVLDLQAALEIVAREMGQLLNARTTGIALLNAARTELSVVTEYSQSAADPSAVGLVIPLANNPSSSQVIETGRSIVVAQHHLNPLIEPTYELMQARQSKRLMIVPLLARGEVIGTIGVTIDRADREFTPAEVTLAETVAGQVAGAIENARLYTETQAARAAAEATNRELSQTLDYLQTTQSQLVEAAKMAALGSLVAGVSHEINTPIGIGVTAASLLDDKTAAFHELYQDGQMKRSDLEKYLDLAGQSSQMILSNLHRAAELIQSFKQVAVDQSSEEKRSFSVKAYLEEVLLSLNPKLKRTQLTTEIHADDSLTLDSYPGAFAQIVTNLVMNSLTHAYEPGAPGRLVFDLKQENGRFIFAYADDGRGIPKEYLSRIFDPFFTTRRGQGGSGLGLNIVYNLVTQKLGGAIRCQSEESGGTKFVIEIPLQL
jgi:signal transduction histidine kinase